MEIKRFSDLIQYYSSGVRRKRLAVVWPSDEATRAAVAAAIGCGAVHALMYGCRGEVEADPSLADCREYVTIVDSPDAAAAAHDAVAAVRGGEADVLMKGMINTDDLLRAVLNKETGILPPGEVITHITVAEVPAYHKLLLFSDPAVIPYPDARQREAQMRYVIDMARRINVECPKAVLVHCSEKPDTRHFAYMESYLDIKRRAAEGDFGRCIVDGPLDVKTALSPAALHKKGIESPVGGDADILVFPDIVSANTFYKTITLFADARIAGMLCGAKAPVVLSSRGDSVESKTMSILLAAM